MHYFTSKSIYQYSSIIAQLSSAKGDENVCHLLIEFKHHVQFDCM